jgi:hypothetical protein
VMKPHTPTSVHQRDCFSVPRHTRSGLSVSL